jgi:HlyD family secretion protein
MATLPGVITRVKTPFLLLVAAAALVYAWQTEHRYAEGGRSSKPDTIAQDSSRARVRIVVSEGRLVAYPGAEVSVGTDIGGTIETLAVREKDRVARGALLATIRSDDLHAELERAEAGLREIDADIRLNEQEMVRAEQLLKAEVWPRQQYDRMQRNLDASLARRANTTAEIRRIQALIDKTRIVAPISGTVTVRHVDRGETVRPGDWIVTLADLSRTRVEAEVDEFDVANVSVGDRATVTAEGFDRQWQGRVEEIPDVVSQRRIKPQDPSKPSDARVLLVKIALEDPAPFKLGQRLEVRLRGNGSGTVQ